MHAVVWALEATEALSALTRKRREDALDAVVHPARRLLELHPLSAADSLHLAAALVAVEERPAAIEIVTFDQRMVEAAEKEGFTVRSA